jgi:lipid A 3-O-deacylase
MNDHQLFMSYEITKLQIVKLRCESCKPILFFRMILNYRISKFASMQKITGVIVGLRFLCQGIMLMVMLAFCGQTAIAQAEENRKAPKYELELRNDNDMYLMIMQDQYYTNGVFLNIRKKIDTSKLHANELNRILTWKLGHEMYNAYTAQIDSIEAIDRPISAYLYLGLEQSHFYTNGHALAYSVTIGSMGKPAFGEELQAGLHDLLNMYHAAGWEYQLKNAFMLNAQVQHHMQFVKSERPVLDVSWQSSAMLGTYQIHVKSGPLFRLGKLASFDKSAHLSARLQSRDTPIETEWYAYYRPEGIFMAYDASMQGAFYLKDKGPVTAKPHTWQLSNQFGVVYANQRSTFKIQYYFNTKESPSSLFRHQYGTLSYAYRF